MSKLRERGNGTYAFDGVDTLKGFLSIDGKCLGNARNRARCTNDLPENKPPEKKLRLWEGMIKGELDKVNDAGFPSHGAAAGLQEVARMCMCKKHPPTVTGYGEAAKREPQEDVLYKEWNRRLWAEFLLANQVHCVYANKDPPALADKVKWREQLGLLASGLPPGKGGGNPSQTVDPPADPSLKATRTGSPAPEPLKRRPSALQKLVSRSHTIGKISTLLSRSAARARSTPEDDDRLRQAHAIVGGIEESPRREHPDQREPESDDDEKSYFHDAVGGPAETDRREHPVHRESENEDDEKPGVMDAPARAEGKAKTPEKRRISAGDTNNGIQRLLDTGVDASPGESILSSAPSATFSEGYSNLNGTPDTLYSHYDPMSAVGKGTSSSESSRPDQKSATVANPAPASHTEETRPRSPDPSDPFKLPRQSTAPRAREFNIQSRMDTPLSGESSAVASRRGPGRRLRGDAALDHGTPTKSRLRYAVPVPGSADNDEGESEEGENEEGEGEEGESEEGESEERESEEGESEEGESEEGESEEGESETGENDEEGQRADGQRAEGQRQEGQPGASIEHPDFKLYWNDSKNYKALEKLLKTLVASKNEDQMKGGYIYIYRREKARGFVKIGRSKERFDKRKREIERACGYEPDLVKEWPMDVAHRAIETCVHCHLGENRYWDYSCVREFKKNERKEADKEKETDKEKGTGKKKVKDSCSKRHMEWFEVRESDARKVVKQWQDFIKTQPFPDGDLSAFWKNEVRLVRKQMGTWKKNDDPALECWGEVMRSALNRWETVSVQNPTADLPLRLRVRSEGKDSVLEIFDEEESSDVPLLSVPMLTRPRPKPGALHTQGPLRSIHDVTHR